MKRFKALIGYCFGRSPTARSERGQGMTEYIIIVSLIAIGTIAVVTVFGNNIRGLFGASADALAGKAKVDPTEYSVKQVGGDSKNAKDLKTFGNNEAP